MAERSAASSNGVSSADRRRASFEELTGAVAVSGMTEEEVGRLIEEVVDEVRAEFDSRSSSPA